MLYKVWDVFYAPPNIKQFLQVGVGLGLGIVFVHLFRFNILCVFVV